jgi:RNA polymerase sigma-70 factor, ECF subfamily
MYSLALNGSVQSPGRDGVAEPLARWRLWCPRSSDSDSPQRSASRCASPDAGRTPDHLLQTSALIDEAYLRLVDQRRASFNNRAHFFAVSAQIMRRILVDYARSRDYAKRGGRVVHVSLDDVAVMTPEPSPDLVALDEALSLLAKEHPRKARIVELRYFAGLTVEEIGEVLEIAPATVMRDWTFARAWLRKTIEHGV